MYLPKSRCNFKHTSGGELAVKTTNEEYIGDYIETSDGIIYKGSDNTSLNIELIYLSNDEDKKRGKSIDVKKHLFLKGSINNFLRHTKPIPASKPTPVDSDYENGYFFRYFVKKINQNGYFEIDKETYNSIKRREGKYDHNLYIHGIIKWSLVQNVFKENAISLNKTSVIFPNIASIFPILNEYHLTHFRQSIQENLHTEGNELYYNDKTPYIGYYHIHPEHGPMEGSVHKETPHAKLYYTNQFPVSDTTYSDFNQIYNKDHIVCYRCRNGNPISQKFDKFVCPTGWSSDPNPCRDPLAIR